MQVRSEAVEKFEQRARAVDSLVCVGLDPEFSKLPERFRHEPEPFFTFCRWIIDETAAFAAAFKPNVAFFEARGAAGQEELERTIAYLREQHPTIFTICDAKRADIGNTNRGYVQAVFDAMGFDAITLHPYLGREALAPFLERADKASIILCRTSNPGADELQDLIADGKPLWEHVAASVAMRWNTHGNCMLVVGATYPEEMARIRSIEPELTFLVPGIGAQGGEVEAVVRAGLDARGLGLAISSSRAILYNDNPAAAARALRDEIRAATNTVLKEPTHDAR
jgi:orotidine-5'-phosphate decarboxylase